MKYRDHFGKGYRGYLQINMELKSLYKTQKTANKSFRLANN
jgi:hypothetical protein